MFWSCYFFFISIITIHVFSIWYYSLILLSFIDSTDISVYENGTICIERSLNYEMESILTLPIYILFPSFYNLSTSITITLFVLDISFYWLYSELVSSFHTWMILLLFLLKMFLYMIMQIQLLGHIKLIIMMKCSLSYSIIHRI